ncbi:Protein LSM12 isoform 1 [Schistosoma japonicum]|uniref:Protein LSM12 isoform 1 n=1 Tax=Schistosoma japonicum TaxID=6182 RepID=Q5DC85_SCHJA|nr:SJCHGC02504 protein [Schistosoma japonicum]KAH8876312.1 Protein LSM12-like protein [Schistosoma japonicum]TNN19422.1 Protein LSM12 isoform 1 [Schistosoma japonicum]CAX74854.1 hypothetical protein [Schistosoma japonicum]CAX74855.1 hypothetical protein [Schistosoma japonicum]
MTVDNLPEPGSTITAYCSDTFIQGDVLCVDASKKLIILQKASSIGRPDTCDLLILRADYLRDLKSIKQGSPPACPELNIEKIIERIRVNERIQKEKLKFYSPDVPVDARELAEHLEMFFSVVWDKPNIIVMEHTIISPPYKENNVFCSSDTQQAKSQTEYVQKVVSRFYQERPAENKCKLT